MCGSALTPHSPTLRPEAPQKLCQRRMPLGSPGYFRILSLALFSISFASRKQLSNVQWEDSARGCFPNHSNHVCHGGNFALTYNRRHLLELSRWDSYGAKPSRICTINAWALELFILALLVLLVPNRRSKMRGHSEFMIYRFFSHNVLWTEILSWNTPSMITMVLHRLSTN